MKSYKRSIKTVAKNYKTDPDEILIFLWDFPKFTYLKNENSVLKKEDVNFVIKTIIPKLKEKNPITINKKEEKRVGIIYKDFNFSLVGNYLDKKIYITKNEVLTIYEELTEDLMTQDDPIFPIGLRDEDLLDMALNHPTTSFEGKLKYPTIQSAAAALMYALSNNHAFHNGNKRTAMVAMLVFLDKHYFSIICEESELFRISINLADHTIVEESYRYPDAEIHYLATWINKHSKSISRGERPITLRKLKRILPRFGCTLLDNGKIKRVVKSVGFLGIQREKEYITKKSIGSTISEGNELSMNLIRSIREDLGLTFEQSGIDSDAFYEDAEFTSSEFINKYKSLLRKLSKT